MASYDPLHQPGDDQAVVPVDQARRTARKMLDRYAGTNIHDHGAIVQAAAAIDSALRSLMAALDAERGEQP